MAFLSKSYDKNTPTPRPAVCRITNILNMWLTYLTPKEGLDYSMLCVK